MLWATPLATRIAGDEAIANLTELHGRPPGLGGSAGHGVPGPSQSSGLSPRKRASKLFSFLRQFGLPQWELDRIRRDNRSVYSLDPDIAALRSFSLNVKIGMQRERNIERAVTNMKEYAARAAQEETFRERHGFWLWY